MNPEENTLKILQLTDLHFCTNQKDVTNDPNDMLNSMANDKKT